MEDDTPKVFSVFLSFVLKIVKFLYHVPGGTRIIYHHDNGHQARTQNKMNYKTSGVRSRNSWKLMHVLCKLCVILRSRVRRSYGFLMASHAGNTNWLHLLRNVQTTSKAQTGVREVIGWYHSAPDTVPGVLHRLSLTSNRWTWRQVRTCGTSGSEERWVHTFTRKWCDRFPTLVFATTFRGDVLKKVEHYSTTTPVPIYVRRQHFHSLTDSNFALTYLNRHRTTGY